MVADAEVRLHVLIQGDVAGEPVTEVEADRKRGLGPGRGWGGGIVALSPR